MSETKVWSWTDGPWHVERGYKPWIVEIMDDKGHHIAQVGSLVPVSVVPDVTQLMAAAPALRDALENWLAVHEAAMQSREAAERLYTSGAVTKAVEQAHSALAASRPPQEAAS